MQNFASLAWQSLPEWRPHIKAAHKFVLEPESYGEMVEWVVSTHWTKWWDSAIPAFPTMFIESQIGNFYDSILPTKAQFLLTYNLTEDEVRKGYVGWLYCDGAVMSLVGTSKRALILPTCYSRNGKDNLLISREGDPEGALPLTGRSIGWANKLGEEDYPPDFGFGFLKNREEEVESYKKDPEELMRFIVGSKGDARMAFGVLAFLNRKTEIQSSFSAKSIVRGIPTPGMTYNIVRLKKEPPVVLEEGGPADSAISTPRREHEVRGHVRTYKSGRKIWVRDHKRGDANLGRVDKEYVL